MGREVGELAEAYLLPEVEGLRRVNKVVSERICSELILNSFLPGTDDIFCLENLRTRSTTFGFENDSQLLVPNLTIETPLSSSTAVSLTS